MAGVLQAYHGVWRDPQDPVLAPQAPWVLECLAVVPEQRGKGVGKQLVRTLLDEGRRRGHSHAGISVTDGNIAAQRAYEAGLEHKLCVDGSQTGSQCACRAPAAV